MNFLMTSKQASKQVSKQEVCFPNDYVLPTIIEVDRRVLEDFSPLPTPMIVLETRLTPVTARGNQAKTIMVVMQLIAKCWP